MRRGLFYILGLNRKTFSKGFFLILLIFTLSFITVTPAFFIAKYMMVLWAIFFLFSIRFFQKSNIKLRKIGLLALTFLFICVSYKIIGLSSAVLGYCITNPFVYFAPLMAMVIIESCDNDSQIRFLFHFISLTIALNVLDSIRLTYMLGIENIAYQQLAEVVAEREGIGGLNLGGSSFVNMIVFYTCVMFFSFLKTSNKTEKILFLLYSGVGTYFILMCSLKASAVVLLLVSLFIQYSAHKGNLRIGRMVVLFVLLIGLFVVLRDAIVNSLISIIGSERISQRLMAFVSYGSDETGTLAGRESLWIVSLQSWLRNPLTFVFGIGEHAWNDFSTTAASGVGNHSDLFDVLARYGLVGGMVLYSSIKIYYDYLREKYGSLYKLEIFAFLILVILMGLTKKFIAGEPAIIIFILFPLCLKNFVQEKSNS